MSQQREKMSNVDTAWLRMDHPTNLMMITGVMTFDQPLDFARARQVIEKRLLKYDRFRQRVSDSRTPLRGPSWELDPNFTLDAHLHRVALPAPGDKATLETLVSDLLSTPLDYTKPLWQFHVVENYNGGSAIISRLHHAIADGIALVRVLLSLTDDSADAVEFEEESEERGRPGLLSRMVSPVTSVAKTAGRITGTVVSESWNTIQNPGRVIDVAKVSTDSAATLGKMTLRWPDPQTLYKGPLGTMKRASWSNPLPLDGVKAIGRVTGGTVNDVLVTVVTGALRRYMEDQGVNTADLNFRAFIPVNLRPLEGPIELGNQFGLVFLSMPVGTVDHVERLNIVKQRMDELKNSPEAVVAIGVLNAMGMVPSDIENVFISFFGSKATAVLTNVPGPRESIYFAGSRLREMMAWVPQSGRLGLGISIISYAGNVQVGINTDTGLVPDPEAIVTYLEDEFAQMMELVYLQEE